MTLQQIIDAISFTESWRDGMLVITGELRLTHQIIVDGNLRAGTGSDRDIALREHMRKCILRELYADQSRELVEAALDVAVAYPASVEYHRARERLLRAAKYQKPE